jgi:MerR family transcriptional regulator, copper efflux regulator
MSSTMRLNADMKSTPVDDDLTIGVLAARFGLATQVLRHWESVGLLNPDRLANGQRRYHRADLFRVAFIQQGKELGFSLDEIGAVLTAADPSGRRAVLTEHHEVLRRRIAEAQAAQHMIEHALKCPHEDFLTCPEITRAVTERIPQ